MSRTVRIDEEFVELVEEIADQLDTTIKGVIEMILEWFFTTKGGFDKPDEDEELEE